MIVHENKNYTVEVNPTGTGSYQVRNKQTMVVELDTAQLPDAINQAEHSNTYLMNRLWEWISKQGASARSEMDADAVLSDLDSASPVN